MVIDFALDNKAKYINLEKLDKKGLNNKLLGNWSYYQLQNDIKYKAEKEGIIVRWVNPAYTSQTCSCCGNVDEGQRVSQKIFTCKNPGCKMFNKEVNADYNAARNIAMKTEFVNNKENKESSPKENQ